MMTKIVLIVVVALLGAIFFSFAYPCIMRFVLEIDAEEAKYAALEGNEQEEESIWYSFVFGDILFDFILFRFVKSLWNLIKDKKEMQKNIKYQLALSVWGIIVFSALVWYFGLGTSCLFFGIFIWLLTVIAVIDFLRMEIPSELNGLIFVLGLISVFCFPNVTLFSRIIGMLIISVPMQLIVFAVPGGFGGGDIKLMFVAGFFLGVKCIVVGFFLGLVLGGVYGAFQLAMKKLGRKEHFAFGPFLSAGLLASAFFGNELMQWYLSAFLGR